MRSFIRRQLSTTERIAATFPPACALPTWSQFLRPKATGRIEFSARLLLNSSSGYSRKRVIEAARLTALPASALGKACRYTLTLWPKLRPRRSVLNCRDG